jgi:hypothetical protein
MGKTYWEGSVPDVCAICRKPFDGVMYDFGHPHDRTWLCSCEACFTRAGGRLGIGFGQQYTQQGDRWVKTGG